MNHIDVEKVEESCKKVNFTKKAQLFVNECGYVLLRADKLTNSVNKLFDKIECFFEADRVFAFEINDHCDSWRNTLIKYSEDLTIDIDDVHEVPIESIYKWIEQIEKSPLVVMDDTDDIKTDENRKSEYEILENLKIKKFIAAPIVFDGKLQGFIGIANPKKNIDSAEVLLSIAYFLSNELQKNMEIVKLRHEKKQAEEEYNLLKLTIGKDDGKNLTEAVLHGVSELYYAIYYIKVETRSFMCFREGWNNVSDVIGRTGDYSAAFDEYIKNYIWKEDQAAMYEFSDFNTLIKRLSGKKSISHIYRRNGIGWARGQFIVAECDKDNNILSILYTVTDINEEKKIEIRKQKMEYKETHDEKTGSLNRIGLNRLVSNSKYKKASIGFVVICIDWFEKIIKELGNEAADEILIHVAQSLKMFSMPSENVAYLGGDTFAVIFTDVKNKGFNTICNRFVQIHRELGKYVYGSMQISLSAGIVYSKNGYSDDIYTAAYKGLFASKSNGRGSCTLVDKEGNLLNEWCDTNIRLRKEVALANSNTGIWSIEFSDREGEENRMYGDRIMHEIMDIPESTTPEEMYKCWVNGIDPQYKEAMSEMIDKISDSGHAEITYLWQHPVYGKRTVRCGGSKDKSFMGGICLYGYHQDLMDTVVVKRRDDSNLIISAMIKAYFCNYYINLTDGTYSTYNGDYTEEHGIPAEGNVYDYIGEFVNTLVEKESRKKVLEFMDMSTLEHRLKNTDFIDCEFLSTCDKGWCRATIIPVKRDKENRLTHVMFVIAVIDESKAKELELQRKLQEALKEAKHANSAKTEFLSRMSHDIRTPMNAILGMTSLATSNIDNKDKVKESLQKIQISGKHLLSLINEVLDMRKIEAGELHIQEEKFNMSEVISNYLVMSKMQIGEHLQTLKINLGDIKHELVIGDSLRIGQILINIMSNAVKYTQKKGTITFSFDELECEQEGKAVYRFVISDNGIGMTKEYIKHIYEPFSRENDTRINKIQGTGLGMAIVNSLVKLMKGDISIESEINKGSTFTITLMLGIQETEDNLEMYQQLREKIAEGSFIYDNKNPMEELQELSYKGKRALIVEDQEFNREIAEEFLGIVGLKSDSAENGQEAMEMLLKSEPGHYDIIFMDIQMPVMNGYETTCAIRNLERKDLSEIPIIAMSANAFDEDENESLARGMNEHIAKPIDIPKFRSVLERWL